MKNTIAMKNKPLVYTPNLKSISTALNTIFFSTISGKITKWVFTNKENCDKVFNKVKHFVG